MHIGPTRLLENYTPIANYYLEEGLCRESQDLDWGNNREFGEVVVDVEDNEDKVEDLWKKNKRLKREKMCQKHLSEVKKSLPRG